MDLQVNSAVTSSGTYPWTVQVTASFGGSQFVVRTISGSSQVIVNGSSDRFAFGWYAQIGSP